MQSAESSVFDRHLQCYRILLFLPAPPRVPRRVPLGQAVGDERWAPLRPRSGGESQGRAGRGEETRLQFIYDALLRAIQAPSGPAESRSETPRGWGTQGQGRPRPKGPMNGGGRAGRGSKAASSLVLPCLGAGCFHNSCRCGQGLIGLLVLQPETRRAGAGAGGRAGRGREGRRGGAALPAWNPPPWHPPTMGSSLHGILPPAPGPGPLLGRGEPEVLELTHGHPAPPPCSSPPPGHCSSPRD